MSSFFSSFGLELAITLESEERVDSKTELTVDVSSFFSVSFFVVSSLVSFFGEDAFLSFFGDLMDVESLRILSKSESSEEEDNDYEDEDDEEDEFDEIEDEFEKFSEFGGLDDEEGADI